MALIKDQTFVCIDCEATGLDPAKDRIVEVAACTFTLDSNLEEYESLINPECEIPHASFQVHHISQDMVAGKPKIEEVLPRFIQLIGRYPIIGHGIQFDVDIIHHAAKRSNIPCNIKNNLSFDTVRLARLYGESPSNSLEQLRLHFNIQEEGAHRAMNDVIVNIQVFKRLASRFKTIEQLKEALSKPILLKAMPLGKHKGRPFKEVPLDYLRWAVHQDFDQDLMYSLKTELHKRNKAPGFNQSANPFSAL